ncbi:MAG: hypothetical protein Q7J38_12640, partial [Gallionella sp.]|nr:hypothetical protein [Gallionella sp.]
MASFIIRGGTAAMPVRRMTSSAKEEKTLDQPLGNLVEVSDLHFAYGKREVLKGINLTIPRGKIVAIL